MEIKYTNYDGDWEESCPHCGKPQKEHQVNIGEHEGVRYIHRQPCEEEQHHIRKEAVKRGIVTRIIIQVYGICSYLWGKIPFKEEIKLIFGFFKNIFISLRAIFYLRRNKPK